MQAWSLQYLSFQPNNTGVTYKQTTMEQALEIVSKGWLLTVVMSVTLVFVHNNYDKHVSISQKKEYIYENIFPSP